MCGHIKQLLKSERKKISFGFRMPSQGKLGSAAAMLKQEGQSYDESQPPTPFSLFHLEIRQGRGFFHDGSPFVEE